MGFLRAPGPVAAEAGRGLTARLPERANRDSVRRMPRLLAVLLLASACSVKPVAVAPGADGGTGSSTPFADASDPTERRTPLPPQPHRALHRTPPRPPCAWSLDISFSEQNNVRRRQNQQPPEMQAR